MPNRILKESICESKSLSEVSFFAEDLYKRLITYADDYGRFNADFQILLARLYPREIQIVSVNDIEDAMTELVGAGKIRFYVSSARDELYGCFPKWEEHQRIRDSKKKLPDPDDTTINDYYLRRFVPYALKKKIIERDKFKCQGCGKYICAGESSADRVIKMGLGLFHIDHIVPVCQGGRATEENLRLLCPTCNLSRKKHFTFEEILEFTNSPQFAATCGEVPQSAESFSFNPIQSESNPESESISKSNPRGRAKKVYAEDPELNQAILDFIEYRKKTKNAMTDKAIELFLNRLNTLSDSVDGKILLINTAIERGWKTVYEPKDYSRPSSSTQDRAQRAIEEVASWV